MQTGMKGKTGGEGSWGRERATMGIGLHQKAWVFMCVHMYMHVLKKTLLYGSETSEDVPSLLPQPGKGLGP